MILEYVRPKDLDEALKILARTVPKTIPLGGGTTISHGVKEPVAVMDLQDLPLNQISRQGNFLHIGATVTLQGMLESPEINPVLVEVLQHEVTLNIRNRSTLAGTLVTADGKSPLATRLLALDAKVGFLPGMMDVSLGDWLPQRTSWNWPQLIFEVVIPLQPSLKFEMVARSPADQPVVCVAIGEWPSGRTRVALGGFGTAPILALDGPEKGGADVAAENAYSQAGDAFASSEYRSQMAKTLTHRLLAIGEIV
jgi:putative selenate reductase FAD-binding subunit